jgi:hypothetical protein
MQKPPCRGSRSSAQSVPSPRRTPVDGHTVASDFQADATREIDAAPTVGVAHRAIITEAVADEQHRAGRTSHPARGCAVIGSAYHAVVT